MIFNNTYREIVSFDLWKRSPTCLMDKPVTQQYRKIASCSSSETNFELVCPRSRSSKMSCLKTCACMPSSQRIRSGCPVKSSITHSCPESMDVWYGSGGFRRKSDSMASSRAHTMMLRSNIIYWNRRWRISERSGCMRMSESSWFDLRWVRLARCRTVEALRQIITNKKFANIGFPNRLLCRTLTKFGSWPPQGPETL